MPEPGPAPDPAAFSEDIFCPVCAYGLYAAPADKCPECGHPLDNLRSNESRIPWTRRRTDGRVRTYWQTVWFVTSRSLDFAEEYAHTLQPADARRFQYVTVLHAWLPFLIATLILYATVPFKPEVPGPVQQMMRTGVVKPGPTLLDRAYAEIWPVAILHACFLPYLWAATAVPTCFFCPRDIAARQQINTIAMARYASAPLGLIPLLLLLFGGVLFSIFWYVDAPRPEAAATAFGVGLAIAALISILAWWMGLLRLVQRIMPLRKQRQFAVGCMLPLIWLALAFVVLVLLPLLVLYVLVVIVSLTG